MNYLFLIRHGESRWNLSNKFTGWVDVPLSSRGVKQSYLLAEEIKNINFDLAYTSELRRAQETLLILLSEQKKIGIFNHKGNKKYLKIYQGLQPKEIIINAEKNLND